MYHHQHHREKKLDQCWLLINRRVKWKKYCLKFNGWDNIANIPMNSSCKVNRSKLMINRDCQRFNGEKFLWHEKNESEFEVAFESILDRRFCMDDGCHGNDNDDGIDGMMTVTPSPRGGTWSRYDSRKIDGFRNEIGLFFCWKLCTTFDGKYS